MSKIILNITDEEYDLNPSLFKTLDIIKKYSFITVSALALELGLTNDTVHVYVKQLEQLGFISTELGLGTSRGLNSIRRQKQKIIRYNKNR